MAEDIALRGWHPSDLADRAGVARSTAGRFLRGDFQTAKTAKKLAKALGYSVRRYIVERSTVDDRREADRREGERRDGDRREARA